MCVWVCVVWVGWWWGCPWGVRNTPRERPERKTERESARVSERGPGMLLLFERDELVTERRGIFLRGT